MNLPLREIVDMAVGRLGLGAEVYAFMYNASDLECATNSDPLLNSSCGTEPAGKFEEFLSVSSMIIILCFFIGTIWNKMRTVFKGDNPEYWDLSKPEIFTKVAQKMAKLHKLTIQGAFKVLRFSSIEYLNSIIDSFTDVPIDINSYQDNIWPWNTQKVYEHLKQPFYAAAWNATDEEIKKNPISTGAILFKFCVKYAHLG